MVEECARGCVCEERPSKYVQLAAVAMSRFSHKIKGRRSLGRCPPIVDAGGAYKSNEKTRIEQERSR